MDLLPPRIVRRLVLAPLVFVLCLAFVAVSPLLLLSAALADIAVRGRWPTVRVAAFAVVYAASEAIGLAGAFVLWIASGFGARMRSERIQSAHYALLGWLLQRIYGAAVVCFGLRIRIVDRPQPRWGPVLVFGRHAGPGNSLMVVGTLMSAYRRRPRIVMLAKLQWDPLFDTVGNRLPNRFIRHDPQNRDRYLAAIEDLAGDMGDRDALVLFPEGKDFTPQLRRRAIARLRRKGHHDEADKAERMRRVLPPRHGGVRAAMRGAPDADIVFVAHTVLEDLRGFRGLWDAIPLDRPIEARYWRVPPTEPPGHEEAFIDWLYEWWRRIDDWIGERRETTTPEATPAAR